ncbi:hypothetical protein OJJOAM_001187 [Cupriavidus sp. H18C1]
MWMKPCSSRRMSFGIWREVRVSPYRKIGRLALRRRTSVTKARSFSIAAASGSSVPLANSSSSIDTMKVEARLDCCANEVRSP